MDGTVLNTNLEWGLRKLGGAFCIILRNKCNRAVNLSQNQGHRLVEINMIPTTVANKGILVY